MRALFVKPEEIHQLGIDRFDHLTNVMQPTTPSSWPGLTTAGFGMADDICTVEETLATMTHLAFEASVSHIRSRGRSSYAGKWRVRLLPQGEHRLSQWAAVYPVVQVGRGAVRGAQDFGVPPRESRNCSAFPRTFNNQRAQSVRRTAAHQGVRCALRRNARPVRGGAVHVGFDGVFEYVSG